jgi:hypothetical protein
MIDSRPVAVLALYDSVRGFVDAFIFIRMTILAIFLALIFNLEFFPVLFVRMPMPSVHITTLTDPEIIGDKNHSGQQYQNDDTDYHDQRSQHMILHNLNLLPSIQSGSHASTSTLTNPPVSANVS